MKAASLSELDCLGHLNMALRVVLGRPDGCFHVDGCQIEDLLSHRLALLARSGSAGFRLRRRRLRMLLVNRSQVLLP